MEWPAHLPLVGGGGVSISIWGKPMNIYKFNETPLKKYAFNQKWNFMQFTT